MHRRIWCCHIMHWEPKWLLVSPLGMANQQIVPCSWLKRDNPFLYGFGVRSEQFWQQFQEHAALQQQLMQTFQKRQGIPASIQRMCRHLGLSFCSSNCCKGQAHNGDRTGLPLLSGLNVKAGRLAAREPITNISKGLEDRVCCLGYLLEWLIAAWGCITPQEKCPLHLK